MSTLGTLKKKKDYILRVTELLDELIKICRDDFYFYEVLNITLTRMTNKYVKIENEIKIRESNNAKS